LSSDYRTILILLSESGLRISELLDCSNDTKNQMLVPNTHTGQTKHSWISFYQTPINEIPKINQDSVSHGFLKVSKSTNIEIYPHLLRSVFAR